MTLEQLFEFSAGEAESFARSPAVICSKERFGESLMTTPAYCGVG
jgi:hypothetical protein